MLNLVEKSRESYGQIKKLVLTDKQLKNGHTCVADFMQRNLYRCDE